jgi:hypothetical protein
VAGERLAFKQSERFLYGVDERPAEPEQIAACSARENDPCHRSGG